MVQVDTLETRMPVIYCLDLPFDVMRYDGVEVEIKVVAVVAKEAESLCFRRQIRGEVNVRRVLLQGSVVACDGIELLAK